MPAVIKSVSSAADMATSLEHVAAVHGSSLAAEVGSWYKGLPGFSPDRVFFIESGGRAISHVCVIDRPILVGGTPIKAGEIALVGTVQDQRGQGYGRAIVEHALGYMCERRYPLAFLFGITEFYEPFGFRYGLRTHVSDRESTFEIATADAAPDPAGYLVRAAGDADLPTLANLYDNDTEEATGRVVRDAGYWRWLNKNSVDTGLMKAENRLIVERNGTATGYALIADRPLNVLPGQNARRFSIAEGIAFDRGTADILLRAAVYKAGLAGEKEMALYLSPESIIAKRAAELGARIYRPSGRDYVRVVDLESLLQQLKGVLETRLARSQFGDAQVSLRIESEEQQSNVTIGRGHPLVVHITMPQADIGPLATGLQPVKDQDSILGSSEMVAVLNVLFPKQHPLFPILDLL